MTSNSSKVNVTVYIARHGECSANVAQTFLDPFTDNLTPVGVAQAELLAKHLKDVPFTGAFASDYPRAEQTARAVLKESKAKDDTVEVKIDTRLRERGYTGLLGVHAKDAINMMHDCMKKGTPYLKIEMENCEGVEEFEARLVSFFSELLKNLQGSQRDQETILIASHGLTIQRLMILLNTHPNRFGISQWTKSDICERQMRNTTYHKLVFEIPKTGSNGVVGHVESAHCRDHTESNESTTTTDSSKEQVHVKDTRNYSFLAGQHSAFEEETIHYCKPV